VQALAVQALAVQALAVQALAVQALAVQAVQALLVLSLPMRLEGEGATNIQYQWRKATRQHQ
jgi:hypothetical protein